MKFIRKFPKHWSLNYLVNYPALRTDVIRNQYIETYPSIPIYWVFSSRSETQKYFPVKFKNQNQDSIDKIKYSIKHKIKIPIE